MKKHREVLAYALISKVLHWLIAVIVLLMLSLSFFLSDTPKLWQPQAYALHKSFGLTVLALMVVRIWAIRHYGRPRLPVTVACWERVVSRGIQYSLYGLLLVMPLSGWVLSVANGRIPVYFGLLTLPLPGVPASEALANWMDLLHKSLAWCLIGLLVLHIAGALKHYFWDNDQVLQRLWFQWRG